VPFVLEHETQAESVGYLAVQLVWIHRCWWRLLTGSGIEPLESIADEAAICPQRLMMHRPPGHEVGNMSRRNKNPVESVELKVSIRADRATADRIRRIFPSAKVRDGTCELKVVGDKPADVAARTEEMMEKLRGAVSPERL